VKIATWNVNSLRSRLDHVTGWLTENPVEALCLQETKVTDDLFPREPLEALGYHCYFSGQKSYNGVAILTRSPLQAVSTGFVPMVGEAVTVMETGDIDEQKRVISGTLDGVRLVNLYVPNGSEIGSEKYRYKLRWLVVLQQYLAACLKEGDRVAVCGDFNIALEDRDIYDPKGKDKHIMSSPTEREALSKILALGFVDAFRQVNQESGQFSWWDYRTGAFPRDRGWRIDHHYVSAALIPSIQSCVIDKYPRTLEKPSDHTPVVLDLLG
jgi:exodeoxyribonuclease III